MTLFNSNFSILKMLVNKMKIISAVIVWNYVIKLVKQLMFRWGGEPHKLCITLYFLYLIDYGKDEAF